MTGFLPSLHNKVIKELKDSSSYKYSDILGSILVRNSFPKDEMFKEKLQERDIYKMTNANQKISNKAFLEKQKLYQEYFDTNFNELYKYVMEQDSWGQEQIIDRGDILSNRALEIWKYPKVIELSQKISKETFLTLEELDPQEATNIKVIAFDYFGTRIAVKTFAELFRNIVEMIYKDHKGYFKPEYFSFITKESKDYYAKNALKLDKGYWLNTISDTPTKIKNLQKIFEVIGLSKNDLVIYFENKD